jgi:formylglycine-generating enzyme
VGSIPAGLGKWGHLDLGGSVFEWALDFTGEKPATCDNCAALTESSAHHRLGGSFASDDRYLLTIGFTGFTTERQTYEFGLRCAHAP